jgi:hypothetical protein
MQDHCFLGNDNRIASVVISDKEKTQIQTMGKFMQRQTEDMPPTKCDFLAAKSGKADGIAGQMLTIQNFSQGGSDREAADSVTCTASAYLKNADKGKHEIPCVESLDDIYHTEATVTNEHSVRTYILCPNRTYEIRSKNKNANNGSAPIIIGRSNVHVLCGADGNSDNNCVLNGGEVQLAVYDEFNIKHSVDNTLVQGVTFTEAN